MRNTTPGFTAGSVLAAEWLKLRTLRSTFWTLAAAVAFVGLAALLAWYSANVWDGLTPQRRERFALSPLADLTSWAVSLCMAVLGVLAATSEHRTGTIRATYAAVPRRGMVLAAKAAVVGAVALAAGQVTVFGTFLASSAIIGDRPITGQNLVLADQAAHLLVVGLSVAVFALLGLALGVLLRSTAGAIVIVVLLWHILPLLVANLPAPWDARIGSFMLAGLPEQVAEGAGTPSVYGDLLAPPAALAVLLAYAAVPLAAAAITAGRRDA
ncbi:ABC transporter permease [Actinomadura miaoliensis]|uniref:ABC transporter permease subunit n=1 Tax=Actinomadura miaoliensis TaxID=430685 RepID=A0ABP7VNM2_9ACTN